MSAQRLKLEFPALSLIAANFMPLFGVLFLGWSVASVLVLYWLESLIIGAFNIPKIFKSRGSTYERTFTAFFFFIHYGGFTAIHGLFVFTLFAVVESSNNSTSLFVYGFAIFSFLLSHLISYKANFIGKREFARRTPKDQMFIPYGRVVIMHLVIIFGGLLVAKYGSPLYALLLLIALKTAIDLAAHMIEHRLKKTA